MYAIFRVKDPDMADDVIAEFFARIAEMPGEDIAEFDFEMLKKKMNEAIPDLRKGIDTSGKVSFNERLLDHSHEGVTPLDQGSETQSFVADVIKRLPEQHRRIMGLELQGMTPAEIARILGVKERKVLLLIREAREDFRRLYKL